MKHLSLLLIFALLFSLTACGTSLNSTTNSPGGVSNSCTHSWQAATCTTPKTCTKCQKTSGTALGHTTDSGICSRCGESFSSWETGQYVDEFEQPTGKKYIVIDAVGTFSNSATTNSKLSASLQIDKDNIGIMLWEYNSNLVKGTFDYEDYDISILDENGAKHFFTGTIYKSSTRIYFKKTDRNAVLALLRNNDTLKVYLESTKYSISTYLFAINSKGFSSAYSTIQ